MITLTTNALTQIEDVLSAVQDSINLGQIEQGMEALFSGLSKAKENMEADDWQSFARFLRTEHPLRHQIHQDPMSCRAFDKPRGYAGDAVMMDYLYNIHFAEEAADTATDLGRAIYRYIQTRPAGQGVRFRREHLAGLIDEIAAAKEGASVLAIASGHLRESELSTALANGTLGRFVALDADTESLNEVEMCYGPVGVETIHASVRHLLARKVKLAPFDFVYAAGLYDYLNDAVAQALTQRMFELTAPGGQMLIPNFAVDMADIAYMETYMNWGLVYRDEYDMTRLLDRVDPNEIASYDVYRDPVKGVVYLRVWKN